MNAITGRSLPEPGPAPTLLEARGVSKSFGGVFALQEVDFDLRPGEVHALLGPNGAGKSTLIKVLNGVEVPDAGSVRVEGRERTERDLATVFQELSLVPSLDVSQNIFLNREIRKFGMVDVRAMRSETLKVTQRLGLHMHPEAPVAALSVAERQLVEIAKAVHREAKVLVLDEPTATLTKADQLLLFDRVRDIQKAGVGIIYVTHRLSEVFELADRVTVIRDGRRVLSAPVSDLTMSALVSAISGSEDGDVDDPEGPEVRALPREVREVPRPASGDESLLSVDSLSGERFSDVSLHARAGEVVGIAGLIGSGRTELLETLAGVRRPSAGQIRVNGKRTAFRSPASAFAAGVALVPEDRHRSGLVLQHSVNRNLALAHHSSLRRWRWGLDERRARQNALRVMGSMNIKAASVAAPVESLSGGNQQKVVFGKWVQDRTRVLLLDEPTQGVDVHARKEIYQLIRAMARRGATVLVVSSDFQELQELCNRIYFMSDGSIGGDLPVSEEVTDQYIYSKLNEGVRQ